MIKKGGGTVLQVRLHWGKSSSKHPSCLTWPCMPVIPALRKLRQVDSWVQGQPGICRNTHTKPKPKQTKKQNKSESKAPLHETSKGFCNRHVSVLSQPVPGNAREWVTWFLNTWLMLHLYGSSRIIIVLWRGLPLTNYQSYREMKKNPQYPALCWGASPCHSASVTTGHCKGTRWSNVDLKYPLNSSLARRHWG